MKSTSLLAVFLLFFCTTLVFAQKDDSFKTVTLSVDKDIAFDKIIDYLQTTGIFIQSVDKQAGFIQAKIFIKNKKIITVKIGERRTMNFILRPADNKTNVTLTVYNEGYYFSSHRVYYYEDEGIMDDVNIYREILDNLQRFIDPI